MRIAVVLSLVCFLIGCGGSDPEPMPGSGGAGGSGGGPASGGGGSAATPGGSGGAASVGGNAGSSSGGAGAAAGGTMAGAGGISGGGSSGGTSGSAGTAGSGPTTCTPAPAGALSVVGDTVHDAKTCLDWMKAGHNGVNYEAAEAYCGDLTLGGFDDWRIPTVSELASLVTRCGKYAPEGPIDMTVFDVPGDGYWTSTSAGEPNKVCAIGMLNAGGYYHYGTAGPQVVRCVRGTGTFPMVKDCTAASGCTNWAQ